MPNEVLTLAQLVHRLPRCSVFLESIDRQEKKGEKCEIAYINRTTNIKWQKHSIYSRPFHLEVQNTHGVIISRFKFLMADMLFQWF